MLSFLTPVERRLVQEVRNNDTLIIVGETGSGKTTRKYPCRYSTWVLSMVPHRSVQLCGISSRLGTKHSTM